MKEVNKTNLKKKIKEEEDKLCRLMKDDFHRGWEMTCEMYGPMIRTIVGWSKWSFLDEEKADIQQDVYVALHKALSNFRYQSSVKWFVKGIAVRHCVDEVRRQVRRRRMMLPQCPREGSGERREDQVEDVDMLNPRAEFIQKERVDTVRSQLEALPEGCQNIIRLFYYKEMSYRGMAGHFGVSVNTVATRLARCLGKLRKKLGRHPEFKGGQHDE